MGRVFERYESNQTATILALSRTPGRLTSAGGGLYDLTFKMTVLRKCTTGTLVQQDLISRVSIYLSSKVSSRWNMNHVETLLAHVIFNCLEFLMSIGVYHN